MNRLIHLLADGRTNPVTRDDRDQSITLLFLAASPLFLWFFRGGVDNMLAGFAFLGLYAFAFWMLSEGLRAEEAYNNAKVAKAPSRPRKLYGALLLGASIMALAFFRLGVSIWPLVFGAMSTGLTLFVFGFDPTLDKGMDTPEAVRSFKRKVLSQNIRKVLEQMLAEVASLGDAEITRRMREFREMAVRLLIAYENDPQNMGDVRKYLRRYLEQAANDVAEFVPGYRKAPTREARQVFLARLAELRADCELTLRQYGSETVTEVDETIEKLLARMTREAAA